MIMVRMGLEASQVDIQGDRVCGAEVKLKVGVYSPFSRPISGTETGRGQICLVGH